MTKKPNKKINMDSQKSRYFCKTRKNSATFARQLFRRYVLGEQGAES